MSKQLHWLNPHQHQQNKERKQHGSSTSRSVKKKQKDKMKEAHKCSVNGGSGFLIMSLSGREFVSQHDGKPSETTSAFVWACFYR